MPILHVSPKQITRFLLMFAIGLAVASSVGSMATHLWGTTLRGLILRFDVNQESSLPTWFSSVMLLACFMLLAFITKLKKQKSDRYTGHWLVLSLLFLYISIDEVATFREIISIAVGASIKTTGVFHYTWVIAAIPFVIILAITYFKFLTHLPQKTRLLFLKAGSLYITGALGTELISGLIISSYGSQNLLYDFFTVIEESLEMIGTIIFLHALLLYLKEQGIRSVQVSVTPSKAIDRDPSF